MKVQKSALFCWNHTITEPKHDKTNNPRHLPSLISLPCLPEEVLGLYIATHTVPREDSDQTGRMPRLIIPVVFAGCTDHFVGFVMLWLTCTFRKWSWFPFCDIFIHMWILELQDLQKTVVTIGTFCQQHINEGSCQIKNIICVQTKVWTVFSEKTDAPQTPGHQPICETILMSTHNICFYGEKRKLSLIYPKIPSLSVPLHALLTYCGWTW